MGRFPLRLAVSVVEWSKEPEFPTYHVFFMTDQITVSNPATPQVTNPAAVSNQTTAQVATATAMTPTIDEILQVCPESDRRNIEKYFPYLARAMAAKGMTSVNQLIAVIATVYVEQPGFLPTPEIGCVDYATYPGDPCGRGYVQLTGRGNYEAASKSFGQDFLANPDLLLEPEMSANVLAWFFSGGSGALDIRPYAEKGDWDNVRSLVNSGDTGNIAYCNSVPEYRAAIQRGIQVFKSGIDPKAVATGTMPGNYGVGCADPGNAGSKTLSTQHNPSTQDAALSYALGLAMLDNHRSHTFHAFLDVRNQPDVLKLDAQTTFNLKGIGDGLDGQYTVEEVIYYFGDVSLEAEVVAYKPDPNAPKPQVFQHDATNSTPSTWR